MYLAWDESLGRQVAIKIPVFDLGAEKKVKRFRQEARAAAKLQHPNIVGIIAEGVENCRPYIVSEFVEGQTLSKAIEQKRPSHRQAVLWVRDLANALHYAHQQGVIHRDVKPDNIMLGQEQRPRLMDFGLAKQIDEDSSLSIDGTVLGTPNYMAPEQARGQTSQVDGRSDQYSLGVVLYELLSGKKPFSGPPHAVLAKVADANHEPPTPRSNDTTIPKDLEAICLRAIAKQRESRYENLGELAVDLERWLHGKPTQARPLSRPERVANWCRRNPALAGGSATLALGMLVILILAWRLMTADWSVAASEPEMQDVAALKSLDIATSTSPGVAASNSLDVAALNSGGSSLESLAVPEPASLTPRPTTSNEISPVSSTQQSPQQVPTSEAGLAMGSGDQPTFKESTAVEPHPTEVFSSTKENEEVPRSRVEQKSEMDLQEAPSILINRLRTIEQQLAEKGGFAVAGQVRDEDGQLPHPGQFTVAMKYNESNGEGTHELPDGWFISERISNERLHYDKLVAATFFHQQAEEPLVIKTGQVNWVVVTLRRSPVEYLTGIAGTVRDEDGEPIQNATVKLIVSRNNASVGTALEITKRTTVDGTYSFAGITPQQYGIAFNKSGYSNNVARLAPVADEPSIWEIQKGLGPAETRDAQSVDLALYYPKTIRIEYEYQTENKFTGEGVMHDIAWDQNKQIVFSDGTFGAREPDLDLTNVSGELYFTARTYQNNKSRFVGLGQLPFDSIASVDESKFTRGGLTPCVENHVYCLLTVDGNFVKFIVRSINKSSDAGKRLKR